MLSATVAGACTPAARDLISWYLPSSPHKQKRESYRHHHNLTTTTGTAVLVPQPMPPSPSAPSRWSPHHPTQWESGTTTRHYHLGPHVTYRVGSCCAFPSWPTAHPTNTDTERRKDKVESPTSTCSTLLLCLTLLVPFLIPFPSLYSSFLVKKIGNKKRYCSVLTMKRYNFVLGSWLANVSCSSHRPYRVVFASAAFLLQTLKIHAM